MLQYRYKVASEITKVAHHEFGRPDEAEHEMENVQ
jgi:hypothetical protein